VDPGPDRSTHVLDDRHTWFGTDLPFSPHSKIGASFQRCEGWLLRRLGETPRDRYEQHHVFPTLLCSFTDVISLVQSIIPTGPTTCRAVVRQFGRTGAGAPFPWQNVAGLWNRLEAVVSRRILAEDMGMFASIQRGLAASENRGVLGACEERIWKFQQWLEAEVRGQKSKVTSQKSEIALCGHDCSADQAVCSELGDVENTTAETTATTHHSPLTTHHCSQ
jgi:choline monooxygenase